MEWGAEKDEAHLQFRLRLEGNRLEEIFADKDWMQILRHNYDRLQTLKSSLRHVLAFRDIDLEQEIINRSTPRVPPPPPTPKPSPAGGTWDEEDDEKQVNLKGELVLGNGEKNSHSGVP